ncbi:phage SPO1 DNA polymerase-related protein, partial [Campylobacter coli]
KNFFIMASFELEFIEKNPSCEKIFIQDLKKIKGFL